MTLPEWELRVAAVWVGAHDRDEDDVLAEILALVAQRPDDDPVARFERAGAYTDGAVVRARLTVSGPDA